MSNKETIKKALEALELIEAFQERQSIIRANMHDKHYPFIVNPAKFKRDLEAATKGEQRVKESFNNLITKIETV